MDNYETPAHIKELFAKVNDEWRKAEAKVKEIAGKLPIYWGSGNAIDHPHVVASTMDAWSGEGMGYNVFVYPDGDGYNKPMKYHRVPIS